MIPTFDTICAHIHNDFAAERLTGRFEIENGMPAGFSEGEYIRIEGSKWNDGRWRLPCAELRDEAFEGAIVRLRPPAAFVRLVEEIAAWRQRYGGAAEGPYKSESVMGVYAYTREGAGWQRVFAGRLDEWRRLA